MSLRARIHRPPDRRFPQLLAGSNFIFGPGGDISIVSATDNIPTPAVVPQHLAPQYVESIPIPSQNSQPLLSTLTPVITFDSSTLPVSITSSWSTSSAIITASSVSVSPATSTVTSPQTTEITSTPATMSASTTSESSQTPSPTSSATDTTHHPPPYYIGIALGVIVVIACLAALIAWGVRLRTHTRRQRQLGYAANVPWAKPHDDNGLEEGREPTFINNPVSGIDSTGLSSQDFMAPWEPRGDRDVGEPKRSSSYMDTPIYDQYSNQYPVLAESVAYPLPLYHSPYTRSDFTSGPQLPSDAIDGGVDDPRSASTLGPLQVTNMMPGDSSTASSRAPTALGMNPQFGNLGTPREDQVRPRFIGLEGKGLRVPWASAPHRKNSTRADTQSKGSANWEQLPSLPMPGEPADGNATGRDGWTASLKSNIINVFNAVAGSSPTSPAMQEGDEEKFTPRPSKRSASQGRERKSLSRDISIASKAWTLEERDDGSGKVHFRGLESYGGCDHAFSPQLLESMTTLESMMTQSDIGTSIYRPLTHESQVPLIATVEPKAALKWDIDANSSRRDTCTGLFVGNGMISRASSIYSTMSAASSVYRHPSSRAPSLSRTPRIPVLSRQSTMTLGFHPRMRKDRASDGRPTNINRLPSSSSFTSYYFSSGESVRNRSNVTDTDDVVRQAVADRRRRVRRVV